MEKVKYDGVLEAAHFNPDGQVEWVRVYERKGAAFSDRILLSRETFIKQLNNGKRYMVGERILNLGGKFTVSQPVHILKKDGKQMIVIGDNQTPESELAGVPLI